MHLLTIETTCDETAAAIVTDQLEVKAAVVASQDALHEKFGGVVPEIASRAHLERILPVIHETLQRANLTLADIDAVAVATCYKPTAEWHTARFRHLTSDQNLRLEGLVDREKGFCTASVGLALGKGK